MLAVDYALKPVLSALKAQADQVQKQERKLMMGNKTIKGSPATANTKDKRSDDDVGEMMVQVGKFMAKIKDAAPQTKTSSSSMSL